MIAINYIFESMLVLGICLGYYHFFLANQTCHSFKRHYLLITALLGMFAPELSNNQLPVLYIFNSPGRTHGPVCLSSI